MPAYSVTLDLPETLYQQLSVQAQQETRTVGEVVVERLIHSAPPRIDDDLPLAIRVELKAMASLSDDALWSIANSTMNADKVALYDLLLDRQQEETLTAEGKELLRQLRYEADTLALRKAHAYALLQSRGHQLPTLTH